MKRFVKWVGIILITGLVIGFVVLKFIVWPKVDADMNPVTTHLPYDVSDSAQTFHDELWVADLHADSLMWRRDPSQRHDFGHVDFPRLREGGVEFQVFSSVTQASADAGFDPSSSNSKDDITTLAKGQLWPIRTWGSIYERAAYQAQRLQKFERQGEIHIVRTSADLEKTDRLLTLLLIEGGHPLEGDLKNISRLRTEGYRAMALQHFFDNELGGSMHGKSQAGLTKFGREAVLGMREQGIIIDVAHSSRQVVRDVLTLISDPVFVSHGGTVAHCPRTANRNLPDDILQQIAARGGIIGIGYFEGAICDISPDGIADAIIDAATLLGPDAVALGSDFDGTVTTSLDTSELAAITDALLRRGMNKENIRKIMGGNVRRFFMENLPDE